MGLRGSVGEKGKNLRDDVSTCQTLLKTKGQNPGPVDGICGQQTIGAIRSFQATFLSRPDGLIEVDGMTWKRLSSTASAPAPPGVVTDWSGDSSKWPQAKKILSLKPELRPKVEAVVAGLRARDFQPFVFYGWRSVAVQLELYERGVTQVKFSFHNAQKPNGTPNAYAADIVDERYMWQPKAASSGFWKALGREAKAQGLYWGGDWTDFPDWAHVQLVPNGRLPDVKRESGL
jgi:peptidoglycan L-alanyl-D-glutamate endopeptidase CwlK